MEVVTVEFDDVQKIVKDLGLEDDDVLYSFTNDCARRSDKYVPLDTGMLKNTLVVGTDYFEYLQPYATKQFYENEGTGKEGSQRGGLRGKNWAERMWTAEGDEIIKELQDYLDRR